MNGYRQSTAQLLKEEQELLKELNLARSTQNQIKVSFQMKSNTSVHLVLAVARVLYFPNSFHSLNCINLCKLSDL